MSTGKRLLAGILTAAAGLVLATQAGAGILGTKHDFSAAGYGSTQLCIFCHAPHNAQTIPEAPLWNHQSTTATYTLYSGPGTMNATVGQPGAVSKLCMSCHDGTVAIGNFGTITSDTHYVTGKSLLGTNLSNDHPIGFTYDAALVSADPGLVSPATVVTAGLPLFSSKMECSTCHGVHDNTNAPFLRKTNASSALCLTCHIK
jgi:predicted CXXCH cytochrome family protein